MSDGTISELVAALEVHSDGVDEEAAASLIALGEAVIPILMDRAAALDASAQLGAIEVFVALKATAAGPVLIQMLDHDDERVRGWAAGALGDLRITEAVPHLYRLLQRSKATGTPPDWSEPANARRALTLLGARTPVIPDGLHVLLFDDQHLGLAVSDQDLDRALDLLRDVDQVIAYFQQWTPWRDTWVWVDDGCSWDLDWAADWNDLVERSHEEARTAPRSQTHGEVAVTIEWLDRTDWETL